MPSNGLVFHPREILDPPLICVKNYGNFWRTKFSKTFIYAKTDVRHTAVMKTKAERQDLKKKKFPRRERTLNLVPRPNKSD